jgi:4'-phosphopantetheinyl transferase
MVIASETILSQSTLSLTNAKVHIWHASLEQPVEVIQKFESLLSEEEAQRANRLRFRQLFIAGRGILRLLLAQYTGVDPQNIQLAYTQTGKPLLSSRDKTSDICFNQAHAAEVGLYAFARGRRIGIDLEAIHPVDEIDRVAEMNFSPREFRNFKEVSEGARLKAFYDCWTRKEAFLKAVGNSVTYPLHEFEVSLEPGAPAQLLSVHGSHEEAAKWSMHDLRTQDGYAASLVVEGEGYSITHKQWAYSNFLLEE